MALDPLIADLNARLKAAGLADMFTNTTGPQARAMGVRARDEFYPTPNIPVGSSEDAIIPSPEGDIAVRIVRPAHGRATATVVYFHGGGWIVGDLDSHRAHAARIANECDAVVVNVAYRLAPEHPFPAGVNDAIAATRYVAAHIDRFGGDPSKLAVAGDSAGGNLAAVVAIWCRDNDIRLAAQLLIYPATDLRGIPDDGAGRSYLGGDNWRTVAADWRVSPITAHSLAGMAPVILGVGAHDFLYQDNLAYVAALRAQGAALDFHEFPTLNHRYFSYTGISDVCLAAAQQLCAALKRQLHG